MDSNGDFGLVVGVVVLVFGIMIYLLPWVVANMRGRDGQTMILLLNILLGWTVLGWLVLLIIAFTGESGSARAAKEEQLALLRRMAEQKQA